MDLKKEKIIKVGNQSKSSNVCLIGIPKRTRKENGQEKFFQEILQVNVVGLKTQCLPLKDPPSVQQSVNKNTSLVFL